MPNPNLHRPQPSGPDKVRILMKLIPMEDFEKVLDRLERKQAEQLLRLMSDDDRGIPEKITKVEAVEVLKEFNDMMDRLVNPNGDAMSEPMQALIQQKLIEFNLVEEQRLYGFDKLAELSVDQIQHIIKDETPQIQAIILSKLDSEKALEVIQNMEKRSLILITMGRTQNVDKDKLKELNDWLEDQIDDVVSQGSYDGAKEVAQLLESLSEEEMEKQLAEMSKVDPDLVTCIRSFILTFTDILSLDMDDVRIILDGTDPGSLGVALRGVPSELHEKALSCLTENARQIAESELQAQRNVPMAEIQAAQSVALTSAREKEANGLVQLRQD